MLSADLGPAKARICDVHQASKERMQLTRGSAGSCEALTTPLEQMLYLNRSDSWATTRVRSPSLDSRRPPIRDLPVAVIQPEPLLSIHRVWPRERQRIVTLDDDQCRSVSFTVIQANRASRQPLRLRSLPLFTVINASLLSPRNVSLCCSPSSVPEPITAIDSVLQRPNQRAFAV